MSENLHVIIAGGGIGGLALAQGLRRAGVGVAVYERDRHRTDRVQGSASTSARTAAGPCTSCCHPGCSTRSSPPAAGAATSTGSSPSRARSCCTSTSRSPPAARRSGRSPTTASAGSPCARSCSPASTTSWLSTRSSSGYEHGPDGRITAHFADDSTATGDVLVGADGGNSLVRAQYLPHARRVDTGIVTIAGKYALTDETRRTLPTAFLEGPAGVISPHSSGMFVAPHEFTSDRVVPVGVGGNDGAAALHPGALFDNTPPYVFWAHAAKRADYPTDRPLESLTGAELHALARTVTSGWGERLRDLVAGTDTDTDTVVLIPISTTEPVDTLLGDAIHSMTPFRGVGANTALRDAQALRRALVATDLGEAPLLDGIHAYETAMRDYGFEAVRASLAAARLAVSGNGIGRVMGRTAFRAMNAIPALKRKAFAGFGDG
ncbi:FAD-dependent oxidoreductase [Pseudonocardia sp. GCM10023141]|uniref:FAD-dependent oxidoreductase n=1 Tax=Pseudonocardia sp. GCM10023141 TaxID=3252653 RepID=UPI003609379C